MKQAQKINTVEAKNRLNEIIARTNKTKDPVIVEKHGKPVAVVWDYDSYQKGAIDNRREQDKKLIQELTLFHRELHKKYPKGTGDSVEILREVRQERASQ